MEMTTIQKRHWDKWIPRIHNMTAYTLANYFEGAPVENIKGVFDFQKKLGFPKLRMNKERTHGQLNTHSNCWFEFEVN